MKPKGGARPGAGRKSLGEERSAKALALLGVSICTKALNREGEFKNLDMEVFLDLAKTFAVKAIPQKLEGDGFGNKTIIYVSNFNNKQISSAPSAADNTRLPKAIQNS